MPSCATTTAQRPSQRVQQPTSGLVSAGPRTPGGPGSSAVSQSSHIPLGLLSATASQPRVPVLRAVHALGGVVLLPWRMLSGLTWLLTGHRGSSSRHEGAAQSAVGMHEHVFHDEHAHGDAGVDLAAAPATKHTRVIMPTALPPSAPSQQQHWLVELVRAAVHERLAGRP